MTMRLLKTLPLSDGHLSMVSAGRRIPLGAFIGSVEIYEEESHSSILGNPCRGRKRILASFVVCDNFDLSTEIHSGNVYEAMGDVQGERRMERFCFAGLRFEDSDPVEEKLIFEITDLELIRKLMSL